MIRSVFNGQKATAGSERILPFFFTFLSEIISFKVFQKPLLDTLWSYQYTKNMKCQSP